VCFGAHLHGDADGRPAVDQGVVQQVAHGFAPHEGDALHPAGGHAGFKAQVLPLFVGGQQALLGDLAGQGDETQRFEAVGFAEGAPVAQRAGMGIGFVADYLSRQDSDVLPLLPQLRIPPLPVWLVVHSEIRGNAPIRAVYDVLAAELPPLL
jgi:DNA-binding transcriptional LysR family regulator